jgi:hypothetical protein
LLSHLRLGLPNGILLLGFPRVWSPMCAACSFHLTLINPVALTIFGEGTNNEASHNAFLLSLVTYFFIDIVLILIIRALEYFILKHPHSV